MFAKRLIRLVWGAAFAGVALFCAFFVFRAWNVMLFPHQVEYGEGPVLDWARQVASGALPYKAIATFPWNFSVYSPGYMAGAAVLLRLLPDAPWLGGRLLSVLSTVGLAGVILLPSRTGRVNAARWLVAGVWLSSPYVFRWATFYRPDMVALAWSALGVVLVQQAVDREQRRLVGVAALCFVLSFWTKQSFFAAPLAAMIFLALRRRDWLAPLIVVGAVGGGGVGIGLWWLTDGAILDNLVAANANPFSWHALWTLQRSFWLTAPVLLALGAWRVWRAPRTLLALYGVLSVLVTVTVGKAGATENYFLEPLWVACALAAHLFGAMVEKGERRALLVPVLVLLQLVLFVPGYERRTPVAELAWLEDLRAENEALREAVGRIPPDAIVWSEQMGVLAEMGRTVPLHSFVYTQLERQGLWEPTPLTSALTAGEAPLLVQRFDAVTDPLGRDRWSRAMLDASERGYTLGERVGEWVQRPPMPFPEVDAPFDFGGGIFLLNWMAVGGGQNERLSAPVDLRAGEPIQIHLLWRSETRQERSLTVSVQLFGPDGARVAQDDFPLRQGMMGGAWPPGALLRDEHTLELPERLQSGGYTMLVTLYESETGNPGGSGTLQGLKVRPTPPEAALAVPHAVAFGEGETMQLVSTDALPERIAPGETMTLRAQWSAAQPLGNLTTFMHLIAPDGSLIAQTDFTPAYATSLWSAGEVVQLDYPLTIPEMAAADQYTVLLGWYDSQTLERLRAQGDDELNEAVSLGQVEVR